MGDETSAAPTLFGRVGVGEQYVVGGGGGGTIKAEQITSAYLSVARRFVCQGNNHATRAK